MSEARPLGSPPITAKSSRAVGARAVGVVRRPQGIPPNSPVWFICASALVALLVLGLGPWMISGRPAARTVAFTGCIFSFVLALIGIGVAITGQRAGVLWSSRNTYSLSRLQVTLWTVLVLSGLAAACACRAFGLFDDPGSQGTLATAMEIQIPTALLAAMGISLATAAAAPAILSMKSQSAAPSQADMNAVAGQVNGDMGALGRVGIRPSGCPPLVKDLFRSDDAAGLGTVDMSKVQQFIVTLLLISTYFAMLFQMFWTGHAQQFDGIPIKGGSALPRLSDGFIWLMGVSHAGYLAYKAAPTSATTPGGVPGARVEATSAADISTLPRPQPPTL